MMVENRLPYETLGGNLSSSETFKQLIEYLRLATEDAQTLSDHAKARGNDSVSFQWRAIAINFAKCTHIVTGLMKDKVSTSVGYTGP